MRSLGSYLVTFFLVMFWIFRIVVAVTGQMGVDFVTQPTNITAEIILLFVVVICIPLIFKRKVLGAVVCLIAYGWYFGPNLVQNILLVLEAETADLDVFFELLIEAIGIIIPLIALFDILIEKSKNKNPMDKKTDWFYKNEAYDRQMDERADKNQYRTGL